jgi:ABC-2 type transport system ATP-binding protein
VDWAPAYNKQVGSKRSRRPAVPADRDAVIVAEGVSKRYPGRPVMMFPPVVSIFDRGLFGRDDSTQLLTRRRRGPAPDPATERFDDDLASLEDPDFDDGDDDDEDDLDDDDYAEELERLTSRLPPRRARPGETFWALRDISLTVARGQAIGVVGERGAGKSTLLRILAGRAFPTEGRVLIRGRVGPLAAELPAAITAAGKGEINLPQACRLLGVEAQVTRAHEAEIHELAQPLITAEGDMVPGAIARLALATAVILPADAILLEEPRGMDTGFMERVGARLRRRLAEGCALVLASRGGGLAAALCDETIFLREGEVAESGAPAPGPAPEEVNGQETAPRRAPTFNGMAALVSVDVVTGNGARIKRMDSAEELFVHVHVETAVPEVDLGCGVSFMPRDGRPSVRIELPQRVRLDRPGAHRLTARIPPGTLPGSPYLTRADAVVSGPGASDTSPIARAGPRFRINGPGLERAGGHPSRLTKKRDGAPSQWVDVDWSLE